MSIIDRDSLIVIVDCRNDEGALSVKAPLSFCRGEAHFACIFDTQYATERH